MSGKVDFVTGDATGMKIPAHGDALLAAGPDFLTEAFRRFGVLDVGNAVTAITACRPCLGGSTGKKFFLTLTCAHPQPELEGELFVKFSRDFDDERRDWQRSEMESEAKFVALSRQPGFPIRVPLGFFADYEAASGSGIVITESIAYGAGAIEPHRRKCLDWQTMEDPLPYYRASVTALARLAGAHKSGALSRDIESRFPFDAAAASADPIRHSAEELAVQLEHGRALARDCPQLMPPELCEPAFLDQLERDVWTVLDHEAELQRFLTGNPALVSLNHWNSHIDNCWFWRGDTGLHCGLIDWGRVGQLTFGSALWGGLSAAHHDVWERHIDDLLALFLAEYHGGGGPLVPLADLKQHLAVHMAVMGVARMLAAPEIIRFRLPGCTMASGPRDPMFEPVSADPARNYLSIYTVLLKQWRREDFGGRVRALLGL